MLGRSGLLLRQTTARQRCGSLANALPPLASRLTAAAAVAVTTNSSSFDLLLVSNMSNCMSLLSMRSMPSSSCSFHTTSTASLALSDFRDLVPRQQRATEPVGRPWSVTELRRKSYDDLHKLWYVLYKERNMLLTEQQLSRRKSVLFPQPQRILKVRKSMGAIKQVLGERKREHLSQLSVMAKAQEATNAQGATVVESNDSPEPTTLV